MARKAVIGPQIKVAVDKMLAEGTVESQSEAFKLIHDDPEKFGIKMTGKSAGTVAASYYREKRRETEGTNPPKQTTKPQAVRPNGASVSDGGNADELVEVLLQAAQNAAQELRTQIAENAELRTRLSTITSALQ